MTDMDMAEYILKACRGVKAPQTDYSTLSRDGLAINLSASHERAVILCVSLGELQAKFDRSEADAAEARAVLLRLNRIFVGQDGMPVPEGSYFDHRTKIDEIDDILNGNAGQVLLAKLARFEKAIGLISEYNKDVEVKFSDLEGLARAALGEGGK